MDYNFHTHTYLCSHADGTPEEYVEAAIKGGIKYMGFSDHAPFRFPDGYQSFYRVPLEKIDEYKNVVFELKEKYKDKIKIFYGFEMEYYPEHFEKMLEIVKNAGAEYLILGQHYIFNEYPNGIPAFRTTDNEEYYNDYLDCVISAIKSGVFTYVAHPDAMIFEDEEKFEKGSEKICVAAKEHNVPLEINFQGIREGRRYPHDSFWKVAGRVGCPVTFGFDAHQAHAACDKESLPKAMEMVRKFNLNYIGKPELKRP